MILLKETVRDIVAELKKATVSEVCRVLYPDWKKKRYHDPEYSKVSHKLTILRRQKDLKVVDMFAKEKVYYVP